MFEGAVAGILNRLLGKYVQDLDTENLNVGIFSGNVNLTDLKLKPEALYELDLPIDVKIGTIGRISLQIPWTNLYTQPVVVNIEDVLVLVGPAISNSYFDPERERRLTRAAKRKILQDLEAESEILKGPQNFFEHLFTAIVNNIQIYVKNVHVRYEDSISSKDGPLACGLCLLSLSIETTNSKWKPSVTPVNAVTVYQMMRVDSLSVYWNPTATALDDAEIAHITPMQYYNWKHYMLTGLDKFSMHHEDFEFLLKPVTCKVKVLINRSGEARVPRLLVDAVLQDSAFQLSRRQYLSIENLLSSFARIKLNRKYRHLHPGVPLSKDVKRWWRYAYSVVVEQRVRPYTWEAIKKHREYYNVYKQTYKSTLRSPNDTELKLDLQKCEDSLPIVSVVIAREQAKFELLSQEPDRIEVVETEFDWWMPNSSPSESDEEEAKNHVELCVKSERSKTLWSHLSSPEKKRVCELIDYAEGAPSKDKSKQYIEHKLNLTLANCSITLMNRSKEVLVISLTQFLASLETRPSAKAYKLSARTENIVIEGVTSEGELVPLVTRERSSTITYTNLLAVDFERNPSTVEADYALCFLLEPIEVLYVEQAITELINFFQTHSMTCEELAGELSSAVSHAGVVGKAVAAYAVSRRKVFHLNVDIKAPCVALPEYGCVHKSGRVMLVDVSRIIIKSDLQPSNLALEDATCMELEERLYDRLHAECSCQVLFCEWNDPWRETRKHADSDLHLIPKFKITVVFSNSIKKEYKLLPRYKLNISLSSFKLNLSDRIIGLLLDFIDNLPFPVPNTVPVSFMDSGDYVEDVEDPELIEMLQLDRVHGDPGYGDLVKLRQKIVAAYLRRNKSAETAFDKTGAKLGFQESSQVFISSEHSDEDMEVYARSVDLPGFDDNVSPSNNINTLLRFIVGEIVINLSRSTEQTEKPYIMLSITKVCLDIALMEFGPAVQLSVGQLLLTDKQHHCPSGQYLELVTSQGELFNLLYRKVRADCPEFRSHFHSVEQALVADTGHISLLLHADALRTLVKYLQYIYEKIQSRHSLNLKTTVVPKTKSLWDHLMKPEADPPVPPGATKFSYSVRASSISMKLCHLESSVLEVRLTSLESDCVFRANDRMIFKLFLSSLHLDDLSESTLYPKLVWPDEDKVLEVKYVRAAPRVYGVEESMKVNGQLRVYVGRLHAVIFCCVLHHLQQFLEPLIPSSVGSEAAQAADKATDSYMQAIRSSPTRLNLVIEIHAPVLLLPQKPSSPNLLVLNMGDLLIENFFKQLNRGNEVTSPIQNPVIDNILIKLVNITFSRAVMTLAGTLEVQEPILEPICIRCDLKRAVGYQQLATISAYRDVLAFNASISMDTVLFNIGQKDLATILAVWSDNLSEGYYIGSIVPSSPTEAPQSDASSVKKLQAFFAQGEPIRKETVVIFTLEGLELKLFSDLDEVLSSPVRDLNHGLAKMTAGEVILQLEHSSDSSLELKASLQSLLVEDIRPDSTILIKRIFQSQGGSTGASDGGCISVRRPPLVDASLQVTGARARQLDVRVDRTRFNIALPFLLQLARTLLLSMPGEKMMEGGVVNHGYVGDLHPSKPGNNNRTSRFPSSSDSTSGYYSTGTSNPEEVPGLSISIQFRQPEVMFFTDHIKSEGHALLVRTELLIDYSAHSNCESLVVSLAGLQVMSKLQSQLKNLPPQMVLKPCDIEFSKSFKNIEEGLMVRLKVSEIEVHIAATTVHTIVDIIEEITTELTIPDEKELFNFSYIPKAEKQEEDLWSPKKLTPYVTLNSEDTYVPPKYPCVIPSETFLMTIPNIRVLFEIEHTVRVPVLLVKLTTEISLHDWSQQMHGNASLSVVASCYNEKLDTWEPLIEPVVQEENIYRPWEITATIYQAKAYPMSSRLDTSQSETETDSAFSSDQPKKPVRKRNEFESETSADECDTDNEMTFIKNPQGRESKHYNVDFNAGNMSILGFLDMDESDSENENGLMNKLALAVGHLFTDDSSAEEVSNDDDSSAPEQSEPEVTSEHEEEEIDKAVSFTDGEKTKKDSEHKTVTLQEPVREDSVDSGMEKESAWSRTCTYVMAEARDALNVTLAPAAARALHALLSACTDRTALASAIVAAESGLLLINDIGPGSTVHLKTKSETDLAGNDRVLAIADYYVDTSRPSTPGFDTSTGDILDDMEVKSKPDTNDGGDEWDCFEGGFPSGGPSALSAGAAASPPAPPAPPELHSKLTDLTLTIRLHDMDNLTILCPQRTVSKLHVLHPSKNATRYYIVVERTSKYNMKKIVVRSPLQVRNETSYALELFYKKTDLEAIGADLIGSVANPFDDKMRLCVIAPQDTYNVPLYIAYHCKLFLLPSNFESYQTATQGIWWMELANDVGIPRDMICPAKTDGDSRIFAMRIITVEGCQTNKISRSIPNYVIRVVPPLGLYNRLPHAVELSCPSREWRVRIEAGERTHTYTLQTTQLHRISVEMHYMGTLYIGSFNLSPDLTEKLINMNSDCEVDIMNKPVQICVAVERNESCELYLYAQHWIINKTGLPLQMKGRHSDVWYEVSEEPLLWSPLGGSGGGGGGWVRGRMGPRVRLRAHHSAWSRAARLAAAAPGLVVCPHTERRTNYRLLMNVTLSELCPQLTKIVTLLPYFLVYNDTKRHLRFMEENEAADLWFDLAPQQCTPFWPQTDTMSMHCKFRDSTVVSQHFPITRNHFTVLRMDKGLAICVEVTGGLDRPFTITFKPYTAGDCPVRIDNLCDDLFLKLHQAESGQVALLSPHQSLLYTWDDPSKERKLIWNLYNNKRKGFVADFGQDGYGEEKVSFHSVKHSTLVATNSVTSKLSSTFKRLTPKSPEPCTSSSDDSDSSDLPEHPNKTKKMRKDKVIVYWISYMDGYQRVFALAQDERIAYQYRMRINAERSIYEVYLSLSGASLSVCVQTQAGVKELAYVSVSDSLPRWELNVSHKWRQLSPDLSTWIEDKYQTDQKKCNLKEYINIDLEKMQMTKPFFSELRRTYNPGIWLQLRKSDTCTYIHVKLQRLQIDNQLNEAIFPTVFHPAPLSADYRCKHKPCLEIVALKQYRPSLNQDVYKYFKVLLQEHCLNLDRGFVNHLFDILNHWKIEEKPAVRLRADLALVHMPLPIIAIKSQNISQKNVVFEYIHLSPVKIVLSLSSRGYMDHPSSPGRPKFGNKKENRPKLFNSDLLEYLFNSWGSSLCDMKDVVLRMSYLELTNAPMTGSALWDMAYRHYWTQLVQQFHVLVLGLSILGNPYSTAGDFCTGLKHFYEPHQGTALGRKALEVSNRLSHAAATVLGLCACAGNRTTAMFDDLPRVKTSKRRPDVPVLKNDVPASVVASDSSNSSSVALALTSLVARPTFDDDYLVVRNVCREAARASLSRHLGVCSVDTALKACVERSGGRLVTRMRMPRHCSPTEGVRPYSGHAALGLQLLALLGRGHFADSDAYVAHAHLPHASHATLLISTQHIFMVRSGASGGSWHVEWSVKLDDLIGVPRVEGDRLLLNIKQDEVVNYFSTDEKVIEVPDLEVLNWLRSKIECALILALEDKRCAEES